MVVRHYEEDHSLRTDQRPTRDCRGPGAFINPVVCAGDSRAAHNAYNDDHDDADGSGERGARAGAGYDDAGDNDGHHGDDDVDGSGRKGQDRQIQACRDGREAGGYAHGCAEDGDADDACGGSGRGGSRRCSGSGGARGSSTEPVGGQADRGHQRCASPTDTGHDGQAFEWA